MNNIHRIMLLLSITLLLIIRFSPAWADSVTDYLIHTNSHVSWTEVSEGTPGAIKMVFPDGTKYYTYTYNKPNDYDNTSVRVTDLSNTALVQKKVFTNVDNYREGAAIWNEGNYSTTDIISDFVNNNLTVNVSYNTAGTLIYNWPGYRDTSMGEINGDFVSNTITKQPQGTYILGGLISNGYESGVQYKPIIKGIN